MRITKIISYIIYVIAFSLICSLASELQMALSAWSWGYSIWSIYTISELLRHFPGHIFYAVLQVVAAILTIRVLSRRTLFYLSCMFSVIGAILTGLHYQMIKILGSLSFLLFLTGQLLPYVAPVIILALIGRKKIVSEPALDVGKETILTVAESEVATKSETKGKLKSFYNRYWYVFDILLIVVVFLYGTLNDPFGLIMYICGLYNQMVIRAIMTFIWVLWLVPAALCFVVLLLRAVISWPKYVDKRPRLLLLRLLVIIGLGAYLILPFTPVRPHGFNMYIKGFEKYIGAKADIVGIRSWLDTLGPDECVVYNITNAQDGSKSSSPRNLQQQEWPGVIGKLQPRHVTLSVDEDKHPKVRLNWGSGILGSWGITIGHETMPTPESDLSRYGEYRQGISKGAYIWYGIE